MIIVRLTGGLGNQMFQYAAARRLAHVNNTALKLDISHFESNLARTYALDDFNIRATIAPPEEVAQFNGREKIRRFKQIAHSLRLHPDWKWVTQKSGYFDPTILMLTGNVYLDGAWQSEQYFRDIVAILRAELTVRNEPTALNRTVCEQIRQVEAVSLHIRRGDYVTNSNTLRMHGLCSIEYYHSALRLLVEKIPSPQFFVFSDDPDWAREYLKLDYPTTFISHNGADKHYEDLRLMSQCRHHIIANSSFSWWGAWLCSYQNKIVFAPRQWFQEYEYDIHDIIPAEWQLV